MKIFEWPWLNNALIRFFNFIHSGVANAIPDKNISYGIAIILMTAIIKIILLPLSIKQLRSTSALNEIQPELKKLEAKYKNDPQRYQQEVMNLYKEKHANPMGGCLPVLIQWPILIALYYVFYNLPGINGVHFLWIKDLGAKARFNDLTTWILPVLSGATQYYMTALMTPPGDNPQAKQSSTMNISMSIFMVFISWSLKAALLLYWVASNLFQIGQTLISNKVENKNKAVE